MMGLDVGPMMVLRGPGPVTATPWQPHSLTTLTWTTFNVISINYDDLWFHTLNVLEGWMWIGKNSLNIIICHLSWFKKLSLCSYTSPHIHLWIFETLWVIIFWVRITHKMLNVNWEKIHSIILSVTYHGLRNFTPLIHIPSKPFVNFQTLWVIIFWVRVTCKKLNVYWEKIHSIILSVTCRGLRNCTPLIHIPSYPFMNFRNPVSYYFLS